MTNQQKKSNKERLETYRYPDFLEFDDTWLSILDDHIATTIAKHTEQNIIFRHRKRQLRKTTTEVDKALESHTDHTKLLTLYHEINEDILLRAMEYVDYINITMKQRLNHIKYEIWKITKGTRTSQNNPETRR